MRSGIRYAIFEACQVKLVLHVQMVVKVQMVVPESKSTVLDVDVHEVLDVDLHEVLLEVR